MQSYHFIFIALHLIENLRRAYAKNAYWPSQAIMMRHQKCNRKTTVVVESDSDSSVAGLSYDENDVSEISISDNNFDTEETIEIQFAMPILESISDVIQSPFTDLY